MYPPLGRQLIFPCALTTRCQGTSAGHALSAQPTVRAPRGIPSARAIAPYVVTRPRGIRRARTYTRAKSAARRRVLLRARPPLTPLLFHRAPPEFPPCGRWFWRRRARPCPAPDAAGSTTPLLLGRARLVPRRRARRTDGVRNDRALWLCALAPGAARPSTLAPRHFAREWSKRGNLSPESKSRSLLISSIILFDKIK